MIKHLPSLGFALAVLMIVAAPAEAQNKITLTDAIKQRLIDAKPLRGDGVTREAFDGRPILVTFFASW